MWTLNGTGVVILDYGGSRIITGTILSSAVKNIYIVII